MWLPLPHLQARLVISHEQRDAAKIGVRACTNVAGTVGRAAVGKQWGVQRLAVTRRIVQPEFVRTGAPGLPADIRCAAHEARTGHYGSTSISIGCCWLLLAASGCCWLLLAAAGCCWLLLAAAGGHL